MRVVVDTNVWVSAFLTPGGTCARVLRETREGRLTVVLDATIEAEYRAVLARAGFGIGSELLEVFLTRLRDEGLRVSPARLGRVRRPEQLPDPDDMPFIAVALAASCPIVTGNARRFPPHYGVEVLSPAQCLERVAPW